MVENIPQKEEDTFFQYIDLNSLDFFFEIKEEIFDPSVSVSAFEENKLPEKKRDKLDKSVISNSSSKTSKSKLSKKAKKNQQKKKIKQKEKEKEELELAKKDSKNGIYSLKPIKEKDKKKDKNQNKQKILDQQKQEIIKQKMMEELINETKKVLDAMGGDDNEINTSSSQKENQKHEQTGHKNKKGKNKNKKNKENNYKDKEMEKEEKKKNKEKEDMEGSKKVDDFIKSIKEKKEKKEKEMQQENIKLLFFNKYKYLFTFDPTNRLKLRDETSVIDEDIIKDLFEIISTKIVDNKELIKEFLVLIDSIAEILYFTPENRKNEKNIELFLLSCIKLINENLPNYSDDNKFILMINVFYTIIKVNLELKEEFPNIFSKLYSEIDQSKLVDSLDKNIKENNKYDIKENVELINALFCYFLIEFFNTGKKDK